MGNFFWKEQKYTKSVGLVCWSENPRPFSTSYSPADHVAVTVYQGGIKTDLCDFTSGPFWYEILLTSQSSLLLYELQCIQKGMSLVAFETGIYSGNYYYLFYLELVAW